MSADKPTSPENRDAPTSRSGESSLVNAARQQALRGRVGEGQQGVSVHSAMAKPERIPEQIGRYRIVRFLAAGGMGQVFEAMQENPRRTVAIKVIKSPDLSKKGIRRFEFESQLLAHLQHPGIAQIYEVGTFHAATGEYPFFSMEFINGLPLTQYASQSHLTSRQRLELVFKVCEAIEHAHLKGIIHRDLKPANILVDSDGQPKVVDFGVARAVDPDLQLSTLLTEIGEPVGTVPYMSPEQLTGVAEEVDARCDVYALGVLIHELLAEELPYDVRGKPRLEAFRVICEEAPTSLGSINRLFRGDLETIVAKAMEKEPAQRYQSVRELAEDISRYLEDRPIRARRLGRIARLTRWCRREPRVAGLSLLAVVLLLVLAIGSTLTAITVEEARREAVEIAAQRRRSLYAAEMNLALQSLERGEFATVQSLLDQQIPRAGQEDLRGFEWYYLWKRMHGEQANLAGHDGPVNGVAFSPDGSLLASCGTDGTLIIWDAATWQQRARLPAHEGEVLAVAFAPNRNLLATAGSDHHIRLWNATNGASLGELTGHHEPVQCLAFSPDGERLASGAGAVNSVDPQAIDPGELIVWDLAEQQPHWSVSAHDDGKTLHAVTDVAFSADGKRLAVAPWGRRAGLWDATSGKYLKALPETAAPAMTLAFAPKESRLFLGGWGDQAMVWDADQEQTTTLVNQRGIHAVAFSPDGRRLLTSNNDTAVIHVWNAATGEQTEEIIGHIGWVLDLAVSPGGEWLASAGSDATVKVWDLQASHGPRVLRGHASELRAVKLSPDATRLASGGTDGIVKLWDLSGDREIGTLGRHQNWVNDLSFSPNGRMLVSGGLPEARAKVWNVANGNPVVTLDGLQGGAAAVAFSPDGRFVATGSATAPTFSSGAIKLWDVEDWRIRWAVPQAHDNQDVNVLAFSPDGTILASGGADRRIRIRNVQSGRQGRILEHQDFVTSLQFSPDGSLLAAGCWLQGRSAGALAPVKIWKTTDWTLHQVLPGHKQSVYGLAFAPDGLTLATGGGIGDVKFWDPLTGDMKGSFQLPKGGWTFGLDFSRDGRLFAVTNGSATQPGDVWLLEAATAEEVAAYAKP